MIKTKTTCLIKKWYELNLYITVVKTIFSHSGGLKTSRCYNKIFLFNKFMYNKELKLEINIDVNPKNIIV